LLDFKTKQLTNFFSLLTMPPQGQTQGLSYKDQDQDQYLGGKDQDQDNNTAHFNRLHRYWAFNVLISTTFTRPE